MATMGAGIGITSHDFSMDLLRFRPVVHTIKLTQER
jgi:hypothetical protein